MDMTESLQIVRVYIPEVAFVHLAVRDDPGGHEVADPLRSVRVELVVIGPLHFATSPTFFHHLS